MQEKVGDCSQCGAPVYCRGGFLDGVVGKDHALYCRECDPERERTESDNKKETYDA